MNNYFIYQYLFTETNSENIEISYSATVIFCENELISDKILKSEISRFYENHNQADRIFVIGGDYLAEKMQKSFITYQQETFKSIPKSHKKHLGENLFLLVFDKNGIITCLNKDVPNKSFLKDLLNAGMTKIFRNRGGLIESYGEQHHFVFPSGKHCNKFLRTGNILLHSSEIYFLASQLLSFLDESKHYQIYCDTSSINSLAFAIQDLKRRIIGSDYKMLPVESFSSYEGLYKGVGSHLSKSLILISSSTSCNIFQRIIDHQPMVFKEDMVLLFYTGIDNKYKEYKKQILCNLNKSLTNPEGIESYDTFTKEDCAFCKKGSHPVKVNGDVFLLERPKINRITLKKGDEPKSLSAFVNQFKSDNKKDNNVIKVNYKENTIKSLYYEVYLDLFGVIKVISTDSKKYLQFKNKLFDYINQYIPSTTKYLIYLPDEGSKALAELILLKIQDLYNPGKLPILISNKEIDNIKDDVIGSAVIVASCISNGKNLLYFSRALRRCNKLRLIYFIGLTRMANQKALDFLKSNLKQGIYGNENSSFIEVERIFCSNETKNTPWLQELNFLKKFSEFIEEKLPDYKKTATIIFDRINLFEESVSSTSKGLANNLFYPSLKTNLDLELRKNFAFLDFDEYHDNVSQSDVYFIISIILNSLRNSKDLTKNLQQTEYVRNLLDPFNFNRFNDGIIQASLLRAAKNNELSYHIDSELSRDMKSFLETLIKHNQSEQGEALFEFLYALACEKMTLEKNDLEEICVLIENNVSNELALAFSTYIKFNVITSQPSLICENNRLKAEVLELKKKIK